MLKRLVGIGIVEVLAFLGEVHQHIGMIEHRVVHVLHDAGDAEADGVAHAHHLPHRFS